MGTSFLFADEPVVKVSNNKGKEPAWLSGKPVNEWFAIKGTKGAGGSGVDAYCGMAIKESTNEIFIASAGGHGVSDNRVVSIDLQADAPVWVQRHAPSPEHSPDVPYNKDGQPAARHTYQSTIYVKSLDRVMQFGCRFTHPGAHEFPKVDGFSLKENKWDPAGTYEDLPKSGYGVVEDTLTGEIWTQGLKKWDPKTKTWSSPIKKYAPNGVRFPYAFDSKRKQLFGLNFQDGQGYGDKVINSVKVPVNGSESIQVTFKPSDALDTFIKEEPAYAGMDYDPENDCFLFYSGIRTGAGRIYVVKPNESNIWEISLYSFGTSSMPPPASTDSGINNRFRYLPKLKGFVLLSKAADDLYFIRTSLGTPTPSK
jgi:hypothetical protein